MNVDECIIRTLSYFDIFNYPLTFSEIKKYLCCPVEVSDDELYETISLLSVVQESDGYYYLLGRNKITQMRSERFEISVEKLAKAKIIAKFLSFIPTINYIGISGSLSMNNASVSDDIDMFFITKKNTLWLSRFLVNIALLVTGQKRARKSKDFKDKICPNMFMEDGSLSFSKRQRSLYIAHEIVQLTSLVNKGTSYQALLQSNKWVTKLFPNIIFEQHRSKKKSRFENVSSLLIYPFEAVSYLAQIAYLKKGRTREIVKRRRAEFHPIDRQKMIMDMYSLKADQYIKLYMDNLWVDRDEARFYMEEKKIRILN